MSNNNDKNGNIFSGDVDPEIADLFGIEENDGPSFDLLFNEGGEVESAPVNDSIDLTKTTFNPISKFFNDTPATFFRDKNYYQKALSGEGEASQRFHKLLSQYLNIEDPKEKSTMRMKLTAAYWELTESIAKKIHQGLDTPKQICLRFGAVLPNLLSPETRDLLSRVITDNETGEPVHYVDEWLNKISTGHITASTTDEVKPARLKSSENLRPQIEKQEGQSQALRSLIQRKQITLTDYEGLLIEKVKTLSIRHKHPEFNDLNNVYSAEHKKAFYDITQSIKSLQKVDKEITGLFLDLEKNNKLLNGLKEKAERLGEVMHVDTSIIIKEFGSLRQMAKMCVGRQGNHLPILMKQYFNADKRNLGTRENLLQELHRIETLDPGLFLRTFKRETNRIVPYFILLPCYGERGVCWEPFEKYNRGTSRGRVAIPMYSKDMANAVITAMADLRWQVAKEKAQHYWMEEGLTGHYYQWFSDKHMKGDVRERFISDYVLWITKESEGTQKLDREVRGVFWRDIPFPSDIRDKLKNRGFVYNELYKKDINRSMSDGY